jgi:hypothetical protein
MSQTVTVFTNPIRICNHLNHTKFRGQSSANTLVNFCVCFKKVCLLYSMEGAGAASKFLPGATYK